MSACSEYDLRLLRYLDNELSGQELEDFRAHLAECPDCRKQLEEEQSLSNLLRRSRPLYEVPESLQLRIAQITSQSSPASPAVFAVAPGRLRQAIARLAPQPARTSGLPVLQWRAWAAAAIILAVVLAVVPAVIRHQRAVAYVDAAVATHLSYLGGQLPAEIQTDSPQAVTAWFAGKVPFTFRLPTSQPSSGPPAYRLTGARLVRYRNENAALVTYAMNSEHISLLVASDRLAPAAGGDVVRAGKLTFHYQMKTGFNVITWSNHGLIYALVSSVQSSARHSCLVCHQNMADRNGFN